MAKRIPSAPLVLGMAGLLPPLAGAIVGYGDLGTFGPVAGGFVLTYAALILSFLGGTWWAFAAREERPSWLLMGLAVVPSLAAWLALPSGTILRGGLVIAGLILLSPVVDWILWRRGLTPWWWLRLRLPSSIALAVLVGLSVWWGR